MINRFIGNWNEFSNFFPVSITYEHLVFPTVEHAYVASKSLSIPFRRDIALMKAEDAGLAKKWGRNAELRPNFDFMKIGLMRNFLRQKFSLENEVLRKKLLSSGDEQIIEGNFWHDNFWGDCSCTKCQKIEGLNWLGKILMEAREVARK